MRKRLLGLFFFFVIMGLCSNLNASQTVANVTWQLSTDIQLPRSFLSLDVDLGYYFFNVYGVFSDTIGNEKDIQSAAGSGYWYENEDHSVTIRVEVRAGTFLYDIRLDDQTLDGIFAMYDKDGNLFAAGSIDLFDIE